MKIWMQWLVRSFALGVTYAFLLSASVWAKADPISFQLTTTQITTVSQGTVTFDGTVTNNSGGTLNASDFFFNFFDFDPSSVSQTIQDLGVATDFLIPNGTSSGVVALFDVTLGSVPAGSSFPIDVVLQDTNSDSSATQTVTVTVPGTGTETTIPEPATLFQLATGLAATLAVRRKRKSSES